MKDLIERQWGILKFLRESKLDAPLQHVMPVLEAFIVGDGKKTSKALDRLNNYWNYAFESIEKNHVTENKVLYEAADDRKRELRKVDQELKFLRQLHRALENVAASSCVSLGRMCSKTCADPCPPCYAASLLDRMKKKELETADTEPVKIPNAETASKDFVIESLKKEIEELKSKSASRWGYYVRNLLDAVTDICTKTTWDRGDIERLKDRYKEWVNAGKPGYVPGGKPAPPVSDLEKHFDAKLGKAFRRIEELEDRVTQLCQTVTQKRTPGAVTVHRAQLAQCQGSLQYVHTEDQVKAATNPSETRVPRIAYGGPEEAEE